ncbi:MAG: bifunctional folylpolyglutamate synthase/dihydrofolate synthase [Candidatus Binatia bacterium]
MDTYSETLQKIYNLRGGMIDLRLDRMHHALALFDHPQNAFPSIHIAGTNGKGSTAAMLHCILSRAGYRTALYTSPHLVSFTERIRLDRGEITQDEVVTIAEEIWQKTAAVDVPLTFFEFNTVMAFIYFARRGADVAVVEVGLGGRLDATNVITPIVSAITTISKDHEAYLGPDEVSIAREKAGIIKPRIPVALGKVSEEVAELLRKIADERQSPSYLLGADFSFSLKDDRVFDYTGIKRYFSNIELALIGRHQRSNAAVALAVVELIRDRFPVDDATIRAGLRQVRWPGRFDIMFERPTVILDGAHNPEAVRALADELSERRQGRNIKLLFATMADKEWEIMLRALSTAVDEVIFTRVDMERSADPQMLAGKLRKPIRHRVISDSRVALRTLLDEADDRDVIVVAGSLYLLGEVRPMLEDIATTRTAGADSAHSRL